MRLIDNNFKWLEYYEKLKTIKKHIQLRGCEICSGVIVNLNYQKYN